MAHGDREKRVRALTDRYIGAGGIAAAIVVTLLLFSGFHASPSIIAAIIIGEVGAKFSMAFLTAYGPPFKEGMHHYLHGFARAYFPFLSLLFCLPLIFLPVHAVALATAAIIMIACPAFMLLISERLFGGVNGDVVGASHEITRAAIVLAIALI
jgi:adenosylcobinamide-GDP ribazoletransferase